MGMPAAPVVVGASGRAVPTSTYRLQVHGGFGFDAAAAQTAYIASLGVSHLYLSPVLQPAPGSTHGYDVVDHGRLNEEAGGREAFDRLVLAAHAAGLGIVVDVVPNHMTVPDVTWRNAALWSLLREGRESAAARWFDIDWDVEDDRVLMPVLGSSLDEVLAAGEPDGGAQRRSGWRRNRAALLRPRVSRGAGDRAVADHGSCCGTALSADLLA